MVNLPCVGELKIEGGLSRDEIWGFGYDRENEEPEKKESVKAVGERVKVEYQ